MITPQHVLLSLTLDDQLNLFVDTIELDPLAAAVASILPVVERDNPCDLEEMLKVIAEIPEVGSETNTSIDSKIELSNSLFDKVMEEPVVGTKIVSLVNLTIYWEHLQI